MLVVIGGHARNTGKTSAICELIRSFPALRWTAVKTTPHAHSSHTLYEEHDGSSGTDTGRYLAAGAAHSLLLTLQPGHEEDAVARLRTELASAPNCVLEGNALLRWLRPDLYLGVISPQIAEFKPSAREAFRQADAFLLTAPLPDSGLTAGKPCFAYTVGQAFSAELLEWLALRLNAEAPPEGSASGQRSDLR